MWSALPSVELENLIVPGPVERGFYVASASLETVRSVQKKLVELLDNENQIPNESSSRHVLGRDPLGPGLQIAGATKLRYSQQRYWRRNSRIGQLIWVDSGNVFDPYGISVEAKKRRLDPIRVLRAIKVGRPFTAFQFQQMLERVPNPALWAPDHDVATPPERVRAEGLKNSQAVWWTPLVIISDLMGLFYDPDLPEDALVRAFRAFMVRLAFLRQRAIVMALLHNDIAPDGRRHLLPDVLKMARRVSVPVLPAVPARSVSPLIAAA